MYIFECKECGGRNEVETGSTYMTCAYCGKQITLPTIQDEERARLFNRANYFRRQGEFDKAISAFTGIVNQDGKDPEATWGLVLAKYGIEYVEDPRSGERIPTCNRVSNNSILTDSDYLATLDNSKDEYTRSLYVKEAERIDKIQKGILAIAKLEEPFDVFICYKESTGGGSRTEDSVLAQDIYDKLTKEGLRVFFSRITLEDKLGQQYEPYIFAALNSAKVMLVVATDPTNVSSVWVKNEWSRFLSIMQSDHDKVLIPCYKKMDVYDLPEELNVYQSQDMSKIGAMQDLVRGVNKICSKAKKAVSYHKSSQENVVAMLDRGFISLRDADFSKADQLFEQVLNLNPHEANAYLGKLMVERKVCVDENLKAQTNLLARSVSFQHAMEFADNDLKQRLSTYEKAVEDNVRSRLEDSLKQTLDATIHSNEAETMRKQIELATENKALAQKKEELERKQTTLMETSKEATNKERVFTILTILLIVWIIVAFKLSLNTTGDGHWIYDFSIAASGFFIYLLLSRRGGRKSLAASIQTGMANECDKTRAEIKHLEDRVDSIERSISDMTREVNNARDRINEMLERIQNSNHGAMIEIDDQAKRLLQDVKRLTIG